MMKVVDELIEKLRSKDTLGGDYFQPTIGSFLICHVHNARFSSAHHITIVTIVSVAYYCAGCRNLYAY